MAKKRYDRREPENDNGWEKRNTRIYAFGQRCEDGVGDPSSHHQYGELPDSETEDDLVFIFYLYGDFVLHAENY